MPELSELRTLGADKPVIAFDGQCNLCNGWVQFVLRHDHEKAFNFSSSLTPWGAACFTRNGQSSEFPDSMLVVVGSKTIERSDAVIAILLRLGRVWRILAGVLYMVPKPIRDAVYNAVANNRYKLFSKRMRCRLPDQSQRDRFLAEVENRR